MQSKLPNMSQTRKQHVILWRKKKVLIDHGFEKGLFWKFRVLDRLVFWMNEIKI